MAKEEYGWAVEETAGGRKGSLITTYVPYQFLIQTAIFKTKVSAQTYILNSKNQGLLKPVRVKVTIEKAKESP